MAAAAAEHRRESPIAQMIGRLRAEKYTTTKEEEDVLVNCANRIKRNGIQAFIAAGSTVWSVTGGLNMIHRLTATVAGAAATAYWVARRSVRPCIEDILALEGSHLQEQLALILQTEQAHNPQLRKMLEKHYYLEPLYDDNSQDKPGVLMRKREPVEEELRKPSVEVSEDDKSLQIEKKEPDLRRISRAAKSATVEVQSTGYAHESTEKFEYPFDTLIWTESEEEPSKTGNNIGNTWYKQKKKMGVLERREYNRKRYLEWQERRMDRDDHVDE